MVMMNQPADLMELLFGESDFLTMGGEVIPPVSEVSDQRLDLNEYGHTDEQYVTLIPDMDTLLDTDDTCPKAVEEVIIEIQSETATTTTSVLEQEQNLIFQFPSTSQTDDLDTVAADGSFFADLTDAETMYSSTVPSTPYSPDSPFSLPPPTPDTACSSDSGYGPYKRSVKDGLRDRIKIKRIQEGKGDLKVEFVPPVPETLTNEEQAKRIEKREKNKLAAQKCREKKRERAELLEAEIKVLKSYQTRHELDIKKLIEERDHLMDIITVHGTVCPDFRVKSANI